jgi:lipopolysaccharide assembly outer membrane protein LptD (OstA)
MTEYKKYALRQVENFLYDAMSAEATPQEIYDTIRDAVQDNLNVYTKSADQARQLLNLLNGVKTLDLGPSFYSKGKLDIPTKPKDKVIKWSLPVEEQENGEYYITLPDDLLEAADLKEGDQIKWMPQDGGSYILQKVKVNTL